jgi:PTH1 family peptidyl-tRNA hydrolase
MKLIFAQGNPGTDYAATRHNVGFMTLDAFAAANDALFKSKPKFFADIAELAVNGEKVLLVKPTTFYNETGKSARAIVDFYKLDPASDILVIHDDLALPFGTLRTREKGSDAGNNGIKSLNAHLGSDYGRLRTGIYNDLRDKIPDIDFVLARFTKDEQNALDTHIIPRSIKIIEDFIAGSHQITSHNALPLA